MRLLCFSTLTKAKPMSSLQTFLKCPRADSQGLTESSLLSQLFLIQQPHPQGRLLTSSLAPTTPQTAPPYLWFPTPVACFSHSGPGARMWPLCPVSEATGPCTAQTAICAVVTGANAPLLFEVMLVEVAKQFYLTSNENGCFYSHYFPP